MDGCWLLLLGALLLLLPPLLLMEAFGALRFRLKIISYCALCVLLSALAVPVCLLKSGGRSADNMSVVRAFGRVMKYVYGMRFEVKGLENFNIEGPCVVISNHQSVLDMMGLFEILPDRCVQIAKKELLYAGPAGIVAYLAGVVYINRKRTSDAKSIMAEVAQTMLKENLKVWVYPEGTRNNNGDLLPFKKGAFHLAIQAQVPIIPVVYASYHTFYNQSRNLFRTGKIKVEVLPRVETKDLMEENASELTEKCYTMMRETFFQLSNKADETRGSVLAAQ
ncbi:1-acyl-sn-glycerol-3-phosphate acyltransferase beta [Microcaecilia unicolor]|uniref:1-acyl-sn-glycerol-3-phosphate acyltransferase n=1 Tax=Microcaecilia unicolor TaxID=1415580 RepID=A0A6P7YEY7_9AMPH|nr:1-acyl-sn-glycerol-3-phosphate acyltransferase beta [Microcaecilia unicolor]